MARTVWEVRGTGADITVRTGVPGGTARGDITDTSVHGTEDGMTLGTAIHGMGDGTTLGTATHGTEADGIMEDGATRGTTEVITGGTAHGIIITTITDGMTRILIPDMVPGT